MYGLGSRRKHRRTSKHRRGMYGLGRRAKSRGRRKRLGDVSAWYGSKRKHSRAAKKGWRKRKALAGLGRRKKSRSRKHRRLSGLGRRKKSRSRKHRKLSGLGRHRKGHRKHRKLSGLGKHRRKGRRKGRRLGYMKAAYTSKTPWGIHGRRKGRKGKRGKRLGYMRESYRSSTPFGIGNFVPGQAIERYRIGAMGRRGKGGKSARPWWLRKRLSGLYGNPDTFGMGAFKYVFSANGVVALGGVALGRTVANVVDHLLHFFLTKADGTKMIPGTLINHVGDMIGAVGGYELGKFVGRGKYGRAVGETAVIGAVGGQLFSYLAMGVDSLLSMVGLKVTGGAKYGGLGRYGAETEERAIGRYGAETEERAIGRYGAETEERAIGAMSPQSSRPGGSRSYPGDESFEAVDAPGTDETPEEEFMGDMAGEPEEEFMGSSDSPF